MENRKNTVYVSVAAVLAQSQVTIAAHVHPTKKKAGFYSFEPFWVVFVGNSFKSFLKVQA